MPLLTVTGLVIAMTTHTAVADPVSPPTDGTQADQAADHSLTWVDKSHRYVTDTTGGFVDWLDRFFGTERSDIESASSVIRITDAHYWDELTGWDSETRVRGKVRLPRVNKRLSLIFSEEEEDDPLLVDNTVPEPVAEESRDSDTSGELQYNVRQKQRIRVDFKVGLRSNGKFKSSWRYRYELPRSDIVIYRFIDTIKFVDGRGFSNEMEFTRDQRISGSQLLRWSNRINAAEEYDGVSWTSNLSFADRLSDHAAFSHSVWVSGITQPTKRTTSYGLGTRYRRSFYRSWLFFEIGPDYTWILDGASGEREGRWRFALKLEAFFEHKSKHR